MVDEARKEAGRPRLEPTLLTVTAVMRVSPRMARVRLTGRPLVALPQDCAGAHIKLFFARAGQRVPCLPEPGPNGPVWPGADARPITRTYSIRRFDAAAPAVEVDFVLHGDDGPASAWAARAVPGDVIGFAGPGGPYPLLAATNDVLLAGDMSALPAISALLESLPASATGRAFIEIPHADDRQSLVYEADVPITWLVSDTLPGALDTALIRAVRADVAPVGSAAWVAGENTTVLTLRDHLLRVRGYDRRCIYTVPYWKAAAAEEHYHAERHRVMDAFNAAN